MIARFRPDITFRQLFVALTFFMRPRAVKDFESAFAEKAVSSEAISFGYGRTAIICALKAFGLESKKIICPAYTCVVVAHAIKYSGNEPVFIDSSSDSFNMNNDLIDKYMESDGGSVGAIIFTSIFGEPVDLDYVKSFRSRYPNVRIIQDCAHSFFAQWKGEFVQNCGDVAIYGLNVSKVIHSIFGGMLTTNDEMLAQKIRGVRNSECTPPTLFSDIYRVVYYCAVWVAFIPLVYSFVNWLDRKGFLGKLTKYYEDDVIDMPKDYLVGMGRPSAAVGFEQVKMVNEIINIRRNCAEIYFDLLKSIDGIKLPPFIEGHTYSHFVILIDDRDKILESFLEKGIQLGWLIEYSIPTLKAYNSCVHVYNNVSSSSHYSKRCINLPLYDVDIAVRVSEAVVSRFG